jgi:hypothetical protein
MQANNERTIMTKLHECERIAMPPDTSFRLCRVRVQNGWMYVAGGFGALSGLTMQIVPDSNRQSNVQPDQTDIVQFLEVFKALEGFEATQRSVRGYGAFDPSLHEIPDPVVVRVLEWLQQYTV